MAELKAISDEFQSEIGEDDDATLAINITWIGLTLYFDKNNFHGGLKNELSIGTPKISEDGSRHREWYALTSKSEKNKQNEPICLSEYADDIASNEDTHVISIHDFQGDLVSILAAQAED